MKKRHFVFIGLFCAIIAMYTLRTRAVQIEARNMARVALHEATTRARAAQGIPVRISVCRVLDHKPATVLEGVMKTASRSHGSWIVDQEETSRVWHLLERSRVVTETNDIDLVVHPARVTRFDMEATPSRLYELQVNSAQATSKGHFLSVQVSSRAPNGLNKVHANYVGVIPFGTSVFVASDTDEVTQPDGLVISVSPQGGGASSEPLEARVDPNLLTSENVSPVGEVELAQNSSRVVALGRGDLAQMESLNPDVVDVRAFGGHSLLLKAKSIGEGTIVLATRDGDIQTIRVRVVGDTTELQKLLAKIIPAASIEVTALRNTIILQGTVPSADDILLAIAVAEDFSPKVLNQIVVGPAVEKPKPAARRETRRSPVDIDELHAEVVALRRDVHRIIAILESKSAATDQGARKEMPADCVVVYTADWCVACRPLEELLAKMTKSGQLQLPVIKVDCTTGDALKGTKIKVIPTIDVRRKSKTVARLEGATTPEKLLKALAPSIDVQLEIKESEEELLLDPSGGGKEEALELNVEGLERDGVGFKVESGKGLGGVGFEVESGQELGVGIPVESAEELGFDVLSPSVGEPSDK